jgi:hypothetical protein
MNSLHNCRTVKKELYLAVLPMWLPGLGVTMADRGGGIDFISFSIVSNWSLSIWA